MRIADGITYVGVNDHDIDLFEDQYPVPFGMAYNSYLVDGGEKIAVMDSVEARFGGEWMSALEAALAGRTPDYLVVQHMEPDHGANVMTFAERYPEATLVASAQAFKMMQAYFGTGFEDRRLVVKDGSTLDLGNKQLAFVTAPNVHWPEVIFTYDATDKVLFTADAFGKFGALDVEQSWDAEARRYYVGIVGKFGANVQKALAKAAKLDARTICSLHGPVLTGDLSHYLGLYQAWSSYEPETPGVVVAYSSVYGHMGEAVGLLVHRLKALGCPRVSVFDLSRDDQAEALADAFRFGTLVLASPTYNGGVFPATRDFIGHLLDHNYQKRTIALMEGGSWAPAAAKGMRAALEPLKNIEYAKQVVTVRGSLDDASRVQIDVLARELTAQFQA